MSLTVLIPNQNIRSEGLPYEQCKKKLDDSCVPPNLPFNITNKTNKQTNKQTNTTKYRKPKNDNMITKYVWWLQTFAFCSYNAIANFFKFTTCTRCKNIQWNLERSKKLYFRQCTQSPSQSTPTILVHVSGSGTLKKDPKYGLQKAGCNPYFGPFFQGHKPTHVFKTRIVGADWLGIWPTKGRAYGCYCYIVRLL